MRKSKYYNLFLCIFIILLTTYILFSISLFLFKSSKTTLKTNNNKNLETFGIVGIPLFQVEVDNSLFTKLSPDAINSCSGAYSLYSVNGIKKKILEIRKDNSTSYTNIYADIYGNLFDINDRSLVAFLGNSNGYIRTWYDQSGKDNHAIQNNTSSQPIISYNSLNNRYQIDFNNNKYFTMQDGTVPYNTSYTVITKHNNINNYNGTIVNCGTRWSTNRTNVFRKWDEGGQKGYANYWWANDFLVSNVYEPNNILTWKFIKTSNNLNQNSYFYKNGYFMTSNSRSNWNCTSNNCSIGCAMYNNTISEPIQGELYSLFLFKSALNDNDRNLVEQVA